MVEAVAGEIVVKRHPAAVAEVRGFVRLLLDRFGTDVYLPCLVASELVTNAIRYGTSVGDDVTVRLSRGEDGTLWLEVQDTTCDPPQVNDAAFTSESGRGMLIVTQCVRHWGVRLLADGAGKVVFAVFDP